MKIVIVDYGMGNIKSILSTIKYLGVDDVSLSDDYETLCCADKIILPGVGSFGKAIAQIKQKNILIISILSIYFVFIMQCFFQTQEFKNAHYAELKTWVKQNVNAADAIYILGYDTLFLPCNTLCLHNRKIAIERLLASAITDNEPFTHRHIRQWEERTRLMFIDMLNTTSDVGFNYYALNTSPLETLNGLVEFRDIRYFLVLQGYSTPESDKILPRVKREFTFITTANAPGGKAGTGGLPYDIYARKP